MTELVSFGYLKSNTPRAERRQVTAVSCWDEGERESRENKGGGGLTLWVDESAAHSSLLQSTITNEYKYKRFCSAVSATYRYSMDIIMHVDACADACVNVCWCVLHADMSVRVHVV